MAEGHTSRGVRFSAEERRKLAAMAEATGRTENDVIRLLVRQAMVSGRPDIRPGGALRANRKCAMAA